MIKIEIDGVTTQVEPGSSIIQAADALQIPIPRFCYHRKLSVAANCRMCLVEVEKSPKALPACATPVAEGMRVWTKSPNAKAAQRAVMEFLLINHPLDCPICDQGGECELQDVAMQYGQGESRYDLEKRAIADEDIGPLIATEMTRCIDCTRCVRFGDEIAGMQELGLVGRSDRVAIRTFLHHSIDSEVSGNIIDLCPVGALTSKPFRFTARAWQLKQIPGISAHDCLGSNLYYHVHNDKIMRVVPRENNTINDIWLSDRDRFSYTALYHTERLHNPLLRKTNTWHHSTWVEALEYAKAGLSLILESFTPDDLACLISGNVTNEELYLLQKFVRSLGCNNIDHRVRQLDFSQSENAPAFPNLGNTISDIEQQDLILVIGGDVCKELPVLGIKLRQMVKHGGKLCVLNPADFNFNCQVSDKIIVPARDMVSALQQLLNNLINSTQSNGINQSLRHGCKRQIILGHYAISHPQASQIFALTRQIAEVLQAKFGMYSYEANSAGAWLTGCVPHRLPGSMPSMHIGKNAYEMLSKTHKCYILYALEPEFDTSLSQTALKTLKEADFVIVFSAYQCASLLEIADVILPIALLGEYVGTMINVDGVMQSCTAAALPHGQSRPGWKVLRVLANMLGLADFEYEDIASVTTDLCRELGEFKRTAGTWQFERLSGMTVSSGLVRLAPVPLYSTDYVVRRAQPLQATRDASGKDHLQINSNTAKQYNIHQGEMVKVKSIYGECILNVAVDERLADDTAIVYQGQAQTLCLGEPYAELEISKC